METNKTFEFKKLDGQIIADVEKYVKNWVKENPFGIITIGCDSQAHGRRIKYSVAVCMQYIDKYGMGHGAHVISTDLWEKRNTKYAGRGKTGAMEEMPVKLWKEAELVVAVAQLIDGNDDAFKKKITVHLDYNVLTEHASNMMFASGVGFITGMGYHAEGKPHAWCSTHVADSYCR